MIGDDVQIGVGVVMIGKMHIGNILQVGANAVILHDFIG